MTNIRLYFSIKISLFFILEQKYNMSYKLLIFSVRIVLLIVSNSTFCESSFENISEIFALILSREFPLGKTNSCIV